MVVMVMVMVVVMMMVMLMVLVIDVVHTYIHLGGWRRRHKPSAIIHDVDIPAVRLCFLIVFGST